MPKTLAMAGTKFDHFFKRDEGEYYKMKRVKGLKYFPLKKLLIEKYRFKELEATQLSDFLM